MLTNRMMLSAAGVVCCFAALALAQVAASTRFTCTGRPSGYYADVDTGCQVYHMCDGLGRQFSYSCPNTTLFQQRMLICDHWYMVNCSKSESNYGANLLIGQRDKPFVSEAEMQQRTPRPDILSVPLSSQYYDGLREAETKYSSHPSNSIVGGTETIHHINNNGLDTGKHQYRPPTRWSTSSEHGANDHLDNNQLGQNTFQPVTDVLNEAASKPQFKPILPSPSTQTNTNYKNNVTPPSKNLLPPNSNLQFSSSTVSPNDEDDSEEYEIDARMRPEVPNTGNVYNFIKRFDPNSPEPRYTAMSTSEIIQINRQLPAGSDVSSEYSDRSAQRKSIKAPNSFNTLHNNAGKNKATEPTRFASVNTKPQSEVNVLIDRNSEAVTNQQSISHPDIRTPDKILLPPKKDFSEQPSTTMGPPIYYEWKWAVPAFDLEPPKENNDTQNAAAPTLQTSESGRPVYVNKTKNSPKLKKVEGPADRPEYNISSYFVPDYVFPLDKQHPGYDESDAETSFQVKVNRPGRSNFGENPACPQCHPAYVNPGTCEPCIVQR